MTVYKIDVNCFVIYNSLSVIFDCIYSPKFSTKSEKMVQIRMWLFACLVARVFVINYLYLNDFKKHFQSPKFNQYISRVLPRAFLLHY